MGLDLAKTLQARAGEKFALHNKFLNEQLPRAIERIGFDRNYVSGSGCYLYDDGGQRYLDFLAGCGVFALGREHPAIKAALHEALDLEIPDMVQMDCAFLPGLLAEQLVGRTHAGIERVFFCNSGSEAIETAIKFARQATRRSTILYTDRAFHGSTTGALALTGLEELRKGVGPLLPDCIAIPFGDIDALERELRASRVAAFVVEPIQSKDVYCASSEYWTAAQELCRRYRTLFVVDEVETGIGRTGRLLCHQHWDLEPDIVTVSGALSGGYVPVGAVLTTDKVFSSAFRSVDDALRHWTTFGGNQLAMVAGLATLDALDEGDVVANAEHSGASLLEKLTEVQRRYELIRDVRGMGLMLGIEFGEPETRSIRRRFRAIERVRPGMFAQMVVVPLFQRHRILTQVAAENVNIIKLLPPLVVGSDEIDYFVAAFEDVMSDAHHGTELIYEVGLTLARGTLGRKPASSRRPQSGQNTREQPPTQETESRPPTQETESQRPGQETESQPSPPTPDSDQSTSG